MVESVDRWMEMSCDEMRRDAVEAMAREWDGVRRDTEGGSGVVVKGE